MICFYSTYLAAYLRRRTRRELQRDDDMRKEPHCVDSSGGGNVPGCNILNHTGVAAGVSQAPLLRLEDLCSSPRIPFGEIGIL